MFCKAISKLVNFTLPYYLKKLHYFKRHLISTFNHLSSNTKWISLLVNWLLGTIYKANWYMLITLENGLRHQKPVLLVRGSIRESMVLQVEFSTCRSMNGCWSFLLQIHLFVFVPHHFDCFFSNYLTHFSRLSKKLSQRSIFFDREIYEVSANIICHNNVYEQSKMYEMIWKNFFT